MTRIGYACTSTIEQNLDSQIIALKAANCEIIRTEQKSGSNFVYGTVNKIIEKGIKRELKRQFRIKELLKSSSFKVDFLIA